ncbi:glycosyltransferase [Oerskovia jenensis]|uniref:glycosyltransferase n=1 Tax=Oerskovia jenensis TaxID=162169 RepID=UPI0036DB93D0
MSTDTAPPLADYARRLHLEPGAIAAEIAALESEAVPERGDHLHGEADLEHGITVVVPTYQGRERITATLDSLAAQTLDRDRFEVVVVANGPDDGTVELVRDYVGRPGAPRLRLFSTPAASAGGARNIALRMARFAYVTFVDDDDRVEREFLGSLLDAASDSSIVVARMIDVGEDGTPCPPSPLVERLAALTSSSTPLRVSGVPWALGFNACKLIPTRLARTSEYDAGLRSGEDLVYMADLLRTADLEVARSVRADSAYVRTVRQHSISRRGGTFEFDVVERLDVLERLASIRDVGPGPVRAVADLRASQSGFVVRYVRAHPEHEDRVVAEIGARPPGTFPWETLHRGTARHLAIAYCFAPYSDTSAVVAAKAIAERARVVDVITCRMDSVRSTDPAISALADRWIASRTVIDARPAFADWGLIAEFGEKALKQAELQDARVGGYETLYSRALWVGSHVAAAAFKLRHWRVRWTAEFSDPLRTDATGARRVGVPADDEMARALRSGIEARGFAHLPVESLFDLVEIATFVLADELVFTNRHQLSYMLGQVGDRRLREQVLAKAVVREHPSPPAEAYTAVASSYVVPEGRVNIGYFGSFYSNRGLDEVMTALLNAPADVRAAVRLHVFCSKPEPVVAEVAALGLSANVHVNGYLPYMEFLNATTTFDVLLVTDVSRDGTVLEINPFLPSKASDYRGAGRPVWGIVDPGSALDSTALAYRSPIGDAPAVLRTLRRIVDESTAQRVDGSGERAEQAVLVHETGTA